MTLLIFGAVFCVVAAVTGIQSAYADSRTGTTITYFHGYGRLEALGFAAVLSLACYCIYRRYRIVWRLGFVALSLSAVQFIFDAWRMLRPQPFGWVGAAAATLVVPFIACYWIYWWQKQRSYFFGYDDEET
jgi:hypothetical protein